MNKEMLDIVNDLSKKPTTELALQIMELSSENLILEQQCKKQKEIIAKTINAIDLVIELIKQQPTKDDRWILDRLNGFKIILEYKEVSE